MKPLTDRDLEMLGEMVYSFFESTGPSRGQGMSPMEFGGSNGSHHGKTATKLVKHGFVEHCMRGHDWGDVTTRDARGSKVYRPTEAGRDAWQVYLALKKGSKIGDGGLVRKFGHMVPSTQRPLTDAEKAELRRKCHLDVR